jgi:acyl-CoA thioesterase
VSEAGELVDADAVRSWIAARPFMAWMGITVDELGRDRVMLSLTIAPHMRYIQGLLHGGLTCVLLDTAIGVAARLQVPSDRAVRTTLLQTRYLAPGRGSLAQVEGTAALTDGMVIGQGVVRIDGTEVAAGQGEFAVVHRDRHVRAAHQARGSVAGR